MTSLSPNRATADVDVESVGGAQASNKDASELENASNIHSSDQCSMEAEKRKNATINKRDMEAEAATKIQAGFRGYQVRKQLKQKVSRVIYL